MMYKFVNNGYVILGIIIPLCAIYGLCIISKRFDKKFKNSPLFFDTKIAAQTGIIRMNNYMMGIVMGKNYTKAWPNKFSYGDFNFREHATTLDKIVCYIYWLAFVSVIILVLLDILFL